MIQRNPSMNQGHPGQAPPPTSGGYYGNGAQGYPDQQQQQLMGGGPGGYASQPPPPAVSQGLGVGGSGQMQGGYGGRGGMENRGPSPQPSPGPGQPPPTGQYTEDGRGVLFYGALFRFVWGWSWDFRANGILFSLPCAFPFVHSLLIRVSHHVEFVFIPGVDSISLRRKTKNENKKRNEQ